MTLEEMDALAADMKQKPDRAHVGHELWVAWVADLVRRPLDQSGLGFPELLSPGGLRIVLDADVRPGEVSFQRGRLQ